MWVVLPVDGLGLGSITFFMEVFYCLLSFVSVSCICDNYCGYCIYFFNLFDHIVVCLIYKIIVNSCLFLYHL